MDTATGSINHDALPDPPPPTSEKTSCLLLALPRELRDIIYDMTLVGSALMIDRVGVQPYPESLGLLLACKQMYSETVGVYQRNVTVATIWPFPHWCMQLPLKRLDQVRCIQIKCTTFNPSSPYCRESNMIKYAKNSFGPTYRAVKQLEIEIDCMEFTAEFRLRGHEEVHFAYTMEGEEILALLRD